jgi:hypothetical protein
MQDVAQGAVFNWVACGAKLVSYSGDDHHAEAVLEFPTHDLPESWGITKKDAHQINLVFIPICKHLGVNFAWKSEGDQFRMIFS